MAIDQLGTEYKEQQEAAAAQQASSDNEKEYAAAQAAGRAAEMAEREAQNVYTEKARDWPTAPSAEPLDPIVTVPPSLETFKYLGDQGLLNLSQTLPQATGAGAAKGIGQTEKGTYSMPLSMAKELGYKATDFDKALAGNDPLEAIDKAIKKYGTIDEYLKANPTANISEAQMMLGMNPSVEVAAKLAGYDPEKTVEILADMYMDKYKNASDQERLLGGAWKNIGAKGITRDTALEQVESALRSQKSDLPKGYYEALSTATSVLLREEAQKLGGTPQAETHKKALLGSLYKGTRVDVTPITKDTMIPKINLSRAPTGVGAPGIVIGQVTPITFVTKGLDPKKMEGLLSDGKTFWKIEADPAGGYSFTYGGSTVHITDPTTKDPGMACGPNCAVSAYEAWSDSFSQRGSTSPLGSTGGGGYLPPTTGSPKPSQIMAPKSPIGYTMWEKESQQTLLERAAAYKLQKETYGPMPSDTGTGNIPPSPIAKIVQGSKDNAFELAYGGIRGRIQANRDAASKRELYAETTPEWLKGPQNVAAKILGSITPWIAQDEYKAEKERINKGDFTSEEKAQIDADARAAYVKARSELKPGETLTVSEEEFLRQSRGPGALTMGLTQEEYVKQRMASQPSASQRLTEAIVPFSRAPAAFQAGQQGKGWGSFAWEMGVGAAMVLPVVGFAGKVGTGARVFQLAGSGSKVRAIAAAESAKIFGGSLVKGIPQTIVGTVKGLGKAVNVFTPAGRAALGPTYRAAGSDIAAVARSIGGRGALNPVTKTFTGTIVDVSTFALRHPIQTAKSIGGLASGSRGLGPYAAKAAEAPISKIATAWSAAQVTRSLKPAFAEQNIVYPTGEVISTKIPIERDFRTVPRSAAPMGPKGTGVQRPYVTQELRPTISERFSMEWGGSSAAAPGDDWNWKTPNPMGGSGGGGTKSRVATLVEQELSTLNLRSKEVVSGGAPRETFERGTPSRNRVLTETITAPITVPLSPVKVTIPGRITVDTFVTPGYINSPFTERRLGVIPEQEQRPGTVPGTITNLFTNTSPKPGTLPITRTVTKPGVTTEPVTKTTTKVPPPTDSGSGWEGGVFPPPWPDIGIPAGPGGGPRLGPVTGGAGAWILRPDFVMAGAKARTIRYGSKPPSTKKKIRSKIGIIASKEGTSRDFWAGRGFKRATVV